MQPIPGRVLLVAVSVFSLGFPGLVRAQPSPPDLFETPTRSELSTPDPAAETAPEPNRSDAAAQAAVAFRRGNVLFDREHFDAALAEYLAAYEVLAGHPRQHRLLYNIALSYERSFRYEQALIFYRRFLDEGGSTEPQAAEVRSILEALERLLGTLRLRTTVDVMELWIDEHRVAEYSEVLRLPPGLHTIEVRARGHIPARREARVVSGQETTIRLELEAVDAFRGLEREIFWAALGVTLATLGTAMGVGIESLADTRELELRLAGPDRWSVEEADIDAVEALSLVADILFGVTGLFAVTSLILTILTDWDGDRSARERTVELSPGGIRAWF